MRVISGHYRGRTLYAPKGSHTRPTTDRVRESLFSSLTSLLGGFEGMVVLDAFAGSGALGIEALSRGAASVLFCENDRNALQALQRNTSFIDEQRYAVMRGDVLQRSLPTTVPFDVVLLDPPYALDPAQVVRMLERAVEEGKLHNEAIVSYEYATGTDSPLLSSPSSLEWQLLTTKTFGDTSIDIYRRIS